MPERYNPTEIERQWQARWEADRLYAATEDPSRPKWYALTMFPYTSGDLHIGHWYAMAPSDVHARHKRMQGYNVLHPIGFDAFGLPAENAAIKQGIHPHRWTMDNIVNMRRQLRSIGAIYDWGREVITCDPGYYRWTQWLFLQFYRAGLAYRGLAPAWWCPGCQTVLANEQVLADGTCERCHSPVSKRDLEQWFFRITRYADELLDHSQIQWPERVCTMQKHWIGRSEGAEISFGVEGLPGEEIRVFTTRPDTVYGVTFMVMAPEHPLVARLTAPERRGAVEEYVAQTRRRSEIERLSTEREKSGVDIGARAVNRLNGAQVPIYIADYVLATYGSGAVMGVPAHDQRDFEFAQKYGLPIPVVISPPDWDGTPLEQAYLEPGTMLSSGPFSGTPSEAGKKAVADHLAERGWGGPTVTYRLRDWLISRQRYWGVPIPIVFCPSCGEVPVPEADLPVLLPEDAEFRPTGESPLLYHEGFVHTACPRCGAAARRETDTMDTFIDSSWYQVRYCSPTEATGPVDREQARYWLPVDQYTGGVEHATMHLLYARFYWKVCRDLGLVEGDEPFIRLYNQGIILGEDNEKMSKSRGNVVNPDDYVGTLGADAVRCFLMFVGPWDQGAAWSSTGIQGTARWLHRVWTLVLEPPVTSGQSPVAGNQALETGNWKLETRDAVRIMHKTVRKVGDDLERFRFNTMLAALMEYTNFLGRAKETALYSTPTWEEAIEKLLLLLAPSAPHLAEELWARTRRPYSIHRQAWPAYDADLAADEMLTIVVQVNGKLRDRLTVAADAAEAEVRELALASDRVRASLNGRDPAKAVYVPGKLLNLVV